MKVIFLTNVGIFHQFLEQFHRYTAQIQSLIVTSNKGHKK